MSQMYTVRVLDQHVAYIWADSVETGENYGQSKPNALWFRLGEETAGSVDLRPGVEVVMLTDANEWLQITPDSVRAANQKESSETAQTAAE